MPRRTRVEYQGRTIEGLSMDFEALREQWAEYKLEDGSVVRLRVVPMDIIKTNEKNPLGDPLVIVQSSILVQLRPPEPTESEAGE